VVEPTGTLWIVATPIGTMEDLGLRALEVLGGVDLILAEDTRRTRALLSHGGVRAGRRLRSFHLRNESRRTQDILAALADGRAVALVSDAGTPVLSDPGYLLVRAARERGIRVCSVPGASAFTAALAASGQPPLPAVLVGFLPAKRGPRRRRILDLVGWPHALVVLLSPHRLTEELSDLSDLLGGERPATLLAELSKVHERGLMATLAELASSDEAASARGEYALVVGPAPRQANSHSEITADEVLSAYRARLAQGEVRREAIKSVAQELGIARRRVFDLLVDTEADDP
jgi:16S rRNA (cytidine1402-2'-O)-methyltransferase